MLLLRLSCCTAFLALAAVSLLTTAAAAPAALDISSSSPSDPPELSDPLAPTKQPRISIRSAGYISTELLLRQIIAECTKREDTVLQIDAQGQLQVLPKLPSDAACPSLDIALRGAERGVGMCTDVALYLLHMGPVGPSGRGARILPLLAEADMATYNAKCTQTTARVFLESMYHEWVSPSGAGGYHLMQVNSEHLFKVHEPLHKSEPFRIPPNTRVCDPTHDKAVLAGFSGNLASSKRQCTVRMHCPSGLTHPGPPSPPLYDAVMDVFLCKTKFCQQLMWQYMTQKGWKAEVWFIGHTSSDILVSDASNMTVISSGGSSKGSKAASEKAAAAKTQPGQQQKQQQDTPESQRSAVHADYSKFLHVKGKSGLKHTAQLLQCWSQHPEFPELTVIGQTSVEDPVTQRVLKGEIKNIKLLPRAAAGQEQLLDFDDIRQLQGSSGVHVCASEREGFGHYLNEARAAGALVVSTDHPPMNELVQDGVNGVLIKPSRTGSYLDWQALGMFRPINAFLSPDDICNGVQRVLAMPLERRQELGHAARKQYLRDKGIFMHRMKVLRRVLHRRRIERKGKAAEGLATD